MDWLISTAGKCEKITEKTPKAIANSEPPYRLYRFLTDVENILVHPDSDRQILTQIIPLVRRLLISSTWISLTSLEPDPNLGWAVQTLYDEPDFPLTVQIVSWLPHQVSPVHNHGTWGIVAIIDGREKNCFWRRTGNRQLPHQLKATGEQVLTAGEIIGFEPNSVHAITTLEPTISFNIYGDTNYDQRFEFNLATSTAQLF